MQNCGLAGGIGNGRSHRPHSQSQPTQCSARRLLPVSRAAQTTAAVASSSSTAADDTAASDLLPAPQPTPDASITSEPAPRRRRRAGTTSAADAQPPAAAAAVAGRKARTKKASKPPSDLQQLFQQDSAASGSRVRRVSRSQPAVLPAGAEQDATKVASANRKAAAEAKASAQLLQHIDPQLLAGFQPFAQSFQAAAKPVVPPTSQPGAQQDAAAAAAGGRGTSRSSSKQEPTTEQEQQQKRKLPTAKPSKRDFIELFSPSPQGQQAQVVRLSKDAPPTPLPDAAKRGAQRLSTLVASRQQLQQQQQQLRQTQQQEQDAAQGAADAGPAAAAAAAAGVTGAIQEDLGTPLAGRQAGITTFYTPAPPKGAEQASAERRPLRLMSLRQQQQAREEARRAAVLMLRERSQREYEATLQSMLDWQPSTASRFYLPGAPTHLPVVVQQQWDALSSGHFTSSESVTRAGSSSSSGTDDASAVAAAAGVAGSSAAAAAGAAAEAAGEPAAAAVRQVSADEQQTLDRISSVMQQTLGVGLPDRALRGERSLLIASLSPDAVRERLGAWVGCCGRDYVAQLMTKEPTLLGHEPKVLLNTLQAVNSEMRLSPQESVALLLKQPALIGLDASELRTRLSGLAAAVGCEPAKAVRLALHSANLIMLHPDYVKERMSALARLMPEAAPKLAKAVVRHPYVLSKSPRAVARNILQMSDTLELSSWATCRLVAGQPSLVNTNYDTLKNRLDKLTQLTQSVRRWNRELQAMSPPALARCLLASDVAISRLQQLADIGATSSRRLPAVNILLTMPAQYWEGLYTEVAAAKEQSAERRLAAAAAAAHDAAGAAGQQEAAAAAAAGREVTRGGLGGHRSMAAAAGDGASALTSMQAMQRSAARALSRLRGRAASPAGAAVGSRGVRSSGEEEEEAEEEMEAGSTAGKTQGLLGGDAVWKSSLQDAILGAAAELGRPWRAGAAGGRGKGDVVQQQAEEQHDRGKQEVAGAVAGGRSRRRR